ncbi:MAG: hypothetical protein HYY67_08700 [Thaumarchaeota archaeon]|nr:hypothetical protein [Nitrososphaerota archaeon]
MVTYLKSWFVLVSNGSLVEGLGDLKLIRASNSQSIICNKVPQEEVLVSLV